MNMFLKTQQLRTIMSPMIPKDLSTNLTERNIPSKNMKSTSRRKQENS